MDVTIFDEHPGREAEAFATRRFERPRITVRELIAARVELEIESNDDRGMFAGAGSDPLADRLNGPAEPHDGVGGADRLIAEAETAFARGRYFILTADRQLRTLDEEIDLAATSEVTFLLLMPLRGG